MKSAVHCAPLVNSCTPGWMVAVAAGAQLAAVAPPPDATISQNGAATSKAVDSVMRFMVRERVRGVKLTALRDPFPSSRDWIICIRSRIHCAHDVAADGLHRDRAAHGPRRGRAAHRRRGAL